MRFVVIDFETFFSDDYTLKKMTTEAYIRDPRFEVHGAAIKWDRQTDARWYEARELDWILRNEDWRDVFLIAHHSHFDGLILNHHYGVVPAQWGCTLSMARLAIGNHLSVSLDSVRAHFGLASKRTPYERFKGRHWHELDRHTQELIAEGCCDEVESIWKIFVELGRTFPREELHVIDTTIRMFTEPVLRADVGALADLWEREEGDKSARAAALGIDPSKLSSSDLFIQLLTDAGIEVEYKAGAKGAIPAIAKTDEFMQSLLEGEDDYIRALCEARLKEKSTLVQTRAERLGFMASRGALPVYLRYCGAHTTRFSGGDRTNFQNSVPALNAAIEAPEGFLIGSPDSSQIECRLLNFIAGQWDKIDEFRNGLDPYVAVASAFAGMSVTKESHPELRQAGKVVELQCGYGSGSAKIRTTLRNKARIEVDLTTADEWKFAYRNTHPAVTNLWRQGDVMLHHLANGKSVDWGPVTISHHRIWLPNGAPLIYDLDYDGETREWRRKTRHGWSKMYGAKLVENLIQALARVVVTQAMIRIRSSVAKIFNMRHDDIGILVPIDGREQERLDYVVAEMKREPEWLPGIPLGAEGSLHTNYVK
jgi:DNA polymerase